MLQIVHFRERERERVGERTPEKMFERERVCERVVAHKRARMKDR